MSTMFDREYVAVSRHLASLDERASVARGTRADLFNPTMHLSGLNIAEFVLVYFLHRNDRNSRLTTMCKLLMALALTSLLVGAAIARAEMKSYVPRAAPYLPIQSLERVW
jgi:hypothetical protein